MSLENNDSKISGRSLIVFFLILGSLILFLNWETWITNNSFQLDFCSLREQNPLGNVWNFSQSQTENPSDLEDLGIPIIPKGILDREFYNCSIDGVLRPAAVLLRPKGGIGNQLFQYACNYALARRNGWPLYIFVDKIGREFIEEGPSREIAVHIRNFALDRFNIILEDWNTMTENWTIEGAVNYLNDSQILSGQYVRDGSVIIQQSNNDYCQSETFFRDYSHEILPFLQFKVDVKAEWSHLVDTSEGEASVGVHIRRGDFVSLNISVPYSFYHNAMVEMSQKLNSSRSIRFFIFSDAVDVVEKELFESLKETSKIKTLLERLDVNVTFVRHKELVSGVQELYLLSRCHHQIIPNSSFGWWGAYLNKNPKKFIIAAHHDPKFFDWAFTSDEQRIYHKIHYRSLYYPVSWRIVDPFKNL